jgi:hypothetical protein
MSEPLNERERLAMELEADRAWQETRDAEHAARWDATEQQHEQRMADRHREFMERLDRIAAAIERLARADGEGPA